MNQLSTFESFLLYLIRAGSCTPYDLQRDATVSIGASVPALRRLAKRGLVVAGRRGVRGRKEYTLTASGRAEVARSLQRLSVEGAACDFESLARLVAVSWSSGRRKLAVDALRSWLDAQAKQKPEGRSLSGPDQDTNAAAMYSWFANERARDRASADIRTAQRLLRQLGRIANGA